VVVGCGVSLLDFFNLASIQMAYYHCAYSTRETIENTKHFAMLVVETGVLGSLVECGVGAGSQIGAMRDAIGTARTIYGFDSFEGIPLASDEDDQQPGMTEKPVVKYTTERDLLKTSGITAHSLHDVRNSLSRWFHGSVSSIVLVKGWFQDTLPTHVPIFEKEKIALLRLDGDLYYSTKVSLEVLFPHLSSGGILIIDDWVLAGCRKACEDYFTDHPVRQLTPPHDGGGPTYFVKV
jgi:O-methyltransferase